MMYQTSWLSIIGLLIEMVGLTLLFVDLLRAKRLTDSTTAIRTLQDSINVSTRDLMMNLHKHVALLSDFMGKYVAILAREAEFEAEARNIVEQPDPERAKLVAFVLDKGPEGFRRVTARMFLDASKALPTTEKIQEAVALNLVSRTEILRSFDQYQQTSKRLRYVAAAGVFLVATGVLLQFTDVLRYPKSCRLTDRETLQELTTIRTLARLSSLSNSFRFWRQSCRLSMLRRAEPMNHCDRLFNAYF